MAVLQTIVLATRNQGKIRELCEPMARLGFEVIGLPEDYPEVEESGNTFEENALIKAHAAAECLGIPAVADDSGLEVDALDGAPGVYSSRYSEGWPGIAGESEDDRNNRKLLDQLKDVPLERRSARFRCCMAMVFPSSMKDVPSDIVVSGCWEGSIGMHLSGKNGFGYDPLFIDSESGHTGAELTREEKMARSHRGKALRKLMEALEQKKLAEGLKRD